MVKVCLFRVVRVLFCALVHFIWHGRGFKVILDVKFAFMCEASVFGLCV